MEKYFDVKADKYVVGHNFHVYRPASLNKPKDNSVMFITESYMDYVQAFENVKECLVFWPRDINVPEQIFKRHAIFKCQDPHREFARFFSTNNIKNLSDNEEMDLINGAYISRKAVMGENCTVFPGAYIGGNIKLGNNVYIGAGVKLIGKVYIGNNVIIKENTVIGADGLTTDRDEDGHALTIPQFGSVVIEDNVHIGANSVIARGAIDETRICKGTKIDNQVFISHNVTIGEDSFVVGETIMFGSSSVGKKCLISGNSTLMNMVNVGDESIVGAGAVVTKSVSSKSVVKGNPAK